MVGKPDPSDLHIQQLKVLVNFVNLKMVNHILLLSIAQNPTFLKTHR